MLIKTPKSLIIAFLLFSLFPYIKILPVLSDLQPNALILAVAIVGVNIFRSIANNVAVGCYGVAALAVCLVPIDRYYYDFYSVYRGVGSAASFVFCVFAWNEIEREELEKIVTNKSVAAVLIIYIIGGLAQMYINPDILSPILSRQSGYGGVGGRGVESFTAEPTYLAIQIVLILRFGFVLIKDSLNVLNVVLGLLIIMIISKSSTIIISGAIGFASMWCLMVLNKSPNRRFVALLYLSVSALVVAIGFAIVDIGVLRSEIRVLKIIEGLVNDGISGLSVNDLSVTDRLKHIEVSFGLAIHDWLIPHGYGDFFASYNSRESNFLVDEGLYVTFNDRIMSGYGGALFELGWFGVVPIYLVTRNLFNSKSSLRDFWLVTLSLILIQSVPLSNPMVAFLASKHLKVKKVGGKI
jgi:hypothetical protein